MKIMAHTRIAQRNKENNKVAFVTTPLFTFTHNIGRLLELCAVKEEWARDLPEADKLAPFAITTHYPSQDEAVTREESLRAIEIASKIRATLRTVLEKMGMNLPLD